MNIANKITLFRIFIIPVYIFFMLFKSGEYIYIAGLIYIIASLSDLLDGYLARKHDMVTPLGQFLDPLADKFILLAALLIFLFRNRIDPVSVCIILSRDVFIISLRAVAALKNITFPAGRLAKLKTFFMMSGLVLMHFERVHPTIVIVASVLYYISVAFTLITTVDYLKNNKNIF